MFDGHQGDIPGITSPSRCECHGRQSINRLIMFLFKQLRGRRRRRMTLFPGTAQRFRRRCLRTKQNKTMICQRANRLDVYATNSCVLCELKAHNGYVPVDGAAASKIGRFIVEFFGAAQKRALRVRQKQGQYTAVSASVPRCVGVGARSVWRAARDWRDCGAEDARGAAEATHLSPLAGRRDGAGVGGAGHTRRRAPLAHCAGEGV